MKTKIAFASMLAIFALCACVKETVIKEEGNEQEPETVLEETPDIQTTEELSTVTAELSDEITKTAYDSEGIFSWTASDRITMVLYNNGSADASKKGKVDKYTYDNKSGAGVIATFSGTAISSPWVEAGLALYPNYNVSSYNKLEEGGSYDVDLGTEAFQVKLGQEIRPNLETPLDLVPLIARKGGDGIYHFKTATGILKITITNIPSAARYVVLKSNNDYYMCGTFNLDAGDTEIKESNYVSGGYYQKSIYFVPETDGETRDFYFPIPTGTIPAGMTLFMDTGSSERILTKTTTKPITITANHITPIKAVTAEHYKTIGTAKFFDKGVTNGYHADVELQQSLDNSKDYRLVNPYGAYKAANNNTAAYDPDPYLYFTITGETTEGGKTKVTFQKHAIGLNMDSSSGNVIIQHPTVDGKWDKTTGDADHNIVRLADGSGNPLVVQLAPFYCYNDMSNGWPRDTYDHLIEILFPGYAPTDVEVTTNSSAASVCGNQINLIITGTHIDQARVKWAASSADPFSGMSDLFTASSGKTMPTTGITTTGESTRYISVQAYNSDGTEIFHNVFTKSVYTLTSTDATQIAGTFKANLRYLPQYYSSKWCYISDDGTYDTGNGSAHSPAITATDNTIIISDSNDAFKGNIMITSILGLNYNGTATDNSFIKTELITEATNSLKDATYTGGCPIYGTLSGSTLTFIAPSSQEAFVMYNGSPVHFAQNNDKAVTFSKAVTTVAGETTVTLTAGNKNLSLPFSATRYAYVDGCLIKFQNYIENPPVFTRTYGAE